MLWPSLILAAAFSAAKPKPCNEHPCPVNCVSEWGEWSGWRTRNLSIITQDDHGGAKCPVNRIEREVITAEPSNGGILCPTGEERKNCSDDRCPVDCVFTWSEWSNCSESCGGGNRSRELNITTEAAHGGEQCPGYDQETCSEVPCPFVYAGHLESVSSKQQFRGNHELYCYHNYTFYILFTGFIVIGLSGALVLCIALTFLACFYRRLITKKEEKSVATLEEISLKTRQEDDTYCNNYYDEMDDYIEWSCHRSKTNKVIAYKCFPFFLFIFPIFLR